MFSRHVADLGLRKKDELATRRALERTAGRRTRATSRIWFALHQAAPGGTRQGSERGSPRLLSDVGGEGRFSSSLFDGVVSKVPKGAT
jgi:hypothetical protein